MASLEFLENVDVFKDLNDDQLTVLQACCLEAEFQRGDKIFGAGETPDNLWIVKDGTVDLKDDLSGKADPQGIVISSLTKGKIFGWSSLVPPYRYRLSACCASRSCKVVKIGKASLIGLFEKDSDLGYKVMSKLLIVVGARFHQFQDEVAKRRGHDIMNRW